MVLKIQARNKKKAIPIKPLNIDSIEKSNVFMMKLLQELAITRKLPQEEGVRLHGNKLYKIETGMELVKYVFKITMPKIIKDKGPEISSALTKSS